MENTKASGKKTFLQLIKFGLVGVSNTLVDIIITNLLVFTIGFNEYALVTALYNAIGYSCGVLNSFILNTRWTFKKEYRRTRAELIKFIAVNILSWGLSFLFVMLFSKYVFADSPITDWVCSIIKFTEPEQVLKVVRLLSKLCAAVLVIIFNFTLTKLFVFGNKSKSKEE